ncbi:scavenger receptor cysteine-rich domain-containing protein DMBT1-like [Saccoglossus kowalevskii]
MGGYATTTHAGYYRVVLVFALSWAVHGTTNDFGCIDCEIDSIKELGNSHEKCDNTCIYPSDGLCDDGGDGSDYDLCALGTDCDDCGVRTAQPQITSAPEPTQDASLLTVLCDNSCSFSGDIYCDDGGDNSDSDWCDLGTDCDDCGSRYIQTTGQVTDATTMIPTTLESTGVFMVMHGVFTTDDLGDFTTEDLGDFTTEDLGEFTTEDLGEFTTENLGEFTTENLGEFTTENLGEFTTENLGEFTTENLGEFTTENLGEFTTENLGEFTTENLGEFTTVLPTTLAETTVLPTTLAETTVLPTTLAETTVLPTTLAETTVLPMTPGTAQTSPGPPTTIPTLATVLPEDDSGCGNEKLLEAPSGILFSTNYYTSSRYRSNTRCQWKIAVADDARVKLVFNNVDVEGCCDFVRVYDGEDETADLIGIYNNKNSPGSYPILSTNNYLFIVFLTNERKNLRGFTARYDSLTPEGLACIPNTAQPGGSGTIGNANFEDNDGSDAPSYCEITISVPTVNAVRNIKTNRGREPTVTVLRLVFEKFDLKLGDILVVIDGSGEDALIVARLSGSTVPEPIIFSSTTFTLKFISSGRGNAKNKGFFGRYSTKEVKDSGCSNPQKMRNRYGRLSSMNFGEMGYYNNDAYCEWKITVPEDEIIEFNFESVSMESCCDLVEIYDGIDDKTSLLDIVSGECAPPPIVSTTNILFVRFYTNAHVIYHGFKATYKASPKPKYEQSGCGGPRELTDESGTITSADYGNGHYPNELYCNWFISAKPGKVVDLKILDLFTESCCDILYIYDGPDASSPLVGQYSGDEHLEIHLTSSQEILSVFFNSDHNVSFDGFLLSYKQV